MEKIESNIPEGIDFMNEEFRFSPRPNLAHEIKWSHCSDTVFEQARQEDKPVLLSISAVWCHWCHVMDEESYSYRPVIDLINKYYLPVRVDSDRRPDINRRYNMGGWPTTVVLTPDGYIIDGGTYMPPKELYGFLSEIRSLYRNHKDDFARQVRAAEEVFLRKSKKDAAPDSTLNDSIYYKAVTAVMNSYDDMYGGFGRQPKFPHPEMLDLLNRHYFKTKDEKVKEMVINTLDAMSEGGMYDREAGGFFRYSTTRDWSIPHYEKMLEDNARLLNTYLDSYMLYGRGKYKSVAEQVINFMNTTLLDLEKGTFGGSQDADEEYYKLKRTERAGKKPPYVDRTTYVDWNALAVSSYIKARYAIGAAECLSIALKNINFLLNECFDEKTGMVHYYLDGRGHGGILSDQAHVIKALLDVYQSLGDFAYLEEAKKLAGLTCDIYFDKAGGGFYEDAPESKVLKRILGGEKSPPLNGLMAEVLMTLHFLRGDRRFLDAARSTLEQFASADAEDIYRSPVLASALDLYLNGPVKVTIVGSPDDRKTLDFRIRTLKTYIPNRVVESLDVKTQYDTLRERGYEAVEGAAAYICMGSKCLEPVITVESMENAFEREFRSSIQ